MQGIVHVTHQLRCFLRQSYQKHRRGDRCQVTRHLFRLVETLRWCQEGIILCLLPGTYLHRGPLMRVKKAHVGRATMIRQSSNVITGDPSVCLTNKSMDRGGPSLPILRLGRRLDRASAHASPEYRVFFCFSVDKGIRSVQRSIDSKIVLVSARYPPHPVVFTLVW
jgi:hypothetical protein